MHSGQKTGGYIKHIINVSELKGSRHFRVNKCLIRRSGRFGTSNSKLQRCDSWLGCIFSKMFNRSGSKQIQIYALFGSFWAVFVDLYNFSKIDQYIVTHGWIAMNHTIFLDQLKGGAM